jgi:hypothetical protein
MILPADMPELDLADLQSMVSNHLEFPDAILRGASFGVPGHPVLIAPDLVSALQGLEGDEGPDVLSCDTRPGFSWCACLEIMRSQTLIRPKTGPTGGPIATVCTGTTQLDRRMTNIRRCVIRCWLLPTAPMMPF